LRQKQDILAQPASLMRQGRLVRQPCQSLYAKKKNGFPVRKAAAFVGFYAYISFRSLSFSRSSTSFFMPISSR
jgi:hypothetical protein